MHSLTKKSTCFFVMAIAITAIVNPVTGLAQSPVSSTSVDNVLKVTMSKGKSLSRDQIDISVCTPGTTTCKTLHVAMDTGSTGLRLNEAALGGLQLGTLKISTTAATPSLIPKMCDSYGAGYTWGALQLADVKLAGSVAKNITALVLQPNAMIQACGGGAKAMTTLEDSGVDGILGIGNSKNGTGNELWPIVKKAQETDPALLNFPKGNGVPSVGAGSYACDPSNQSSCEIISTKAKVVSSNPSALSDGSNLIARLSENNNGYIISLPPYVKGTDLDKWSGQLILGINTASNNQLPSSATVIPTLPGGYLNAVYNGVAHYLSIWDSGAPLSTIPAPTSASDTSETISFQYLNDASKSYNATLPPPLTLSQISLGLLADPLFLFAPDKTAAAPAAMARFVIGNNTGTQIKDDSGTIMMGLPMFFGKDIYFAITGQTVTTSTGSTTGPFVSFASYGTAAAQAISASDAAKSPFSDPKATNDENQSSGGILGLVGGVIGVVLTIVGGVINTVGHLLFG